MKFELKVFRICVESFPKLSYMFLNFYLKVFKFELIVLKIRVDSF